MAENTAFMNCVLRVNVQSSGWQKIVAAVLDNIQGVMRFKMDEKGIVEVSGTVNPSLLLKMLGKAGKQAELCWFQFGQCSSNLYSSLPGTGTSNGPYYANMYGCTDYGCYNHSFKGHVQRPQLCTDSFKSVSSSGGGSSGGTGEGVHCCCLM